MAKRGRKPRVWTEEDKARWEAAAPLREQMKKNKEMGIYDPELRKQYYEATKHILTPEEEEEKKKHYSAGGKKAAAKNPYNHGERGKDAVKEVVVGRYTLPKSDRDDWKPTEGELAERSRRMNMTKYEKANRVETILDWMKSGMSTINIVKKVAKEYQVCPSTAKKWIQLANECLDEYVVKNVETVRKQQMVRLEELLQKAIETEDIRLANQIIDTINKTAGVYNVKNETPTVMPVISFKFGGMDNEEQKATVVSVANNINPEMGETALEIVNDAQNNGLI